MYCNAPTVDGHLLTDSIERWKHFNHYVCCANANEPAWYLCSLQAFWVAYPFFFRWISTRKLEKVIAAMFLCLSWTLFYPVITGFDWLPWNKQQWGDPFPTFQAYHPLSHFHKFVFGMCVARCFVDVFCRPNPQNPNGKMFISETQINKVAEARFFGPAGWFFIVLLYGFSDKDKVEFIFPFL